jgi:ATP synthase F1 complex assembly factor 2
MACLPSCCRRYFANAARDNRIAGRLRFYRNVGVEQAKAPWLLKDQSSMPVHVVDSGISAGVDGTDSASGVSMKRVTNKSVLQQQLTPRVPGSNLLLASSPSADTTHSQYIQKTELDWYAITLDGRHLRTPLGQPLVVPSQLLAFAIAAEWDSQSPTLKPAQMPLMTLTCTTLDLQLLHTQQSCLAYLHTDTTCYWADPLQDRALHRRQQDYWTPIHAFVQDTFGHAPATVVGAHESVLVKKLPHNPLLVRACHDKAENLDAWHFTLLHSICSETKSYCVAMALLLDPNMDLAQAVQASRVEEEFNISNWGMVEGGHDYDRLNCSVQLHAAIVLKDCLAIDCFALKT